MYASSSSSSANSGDLDYSDSSSDQSNGGDTPPPRCRFEHNCNAVKTGHCRFFHPICKHGLNCRRLKRKACTFYHPQWHFDQIQDSIPRPKKRDQHSIATPSDRSDSDSLSQFSWSQSRQHQINSHPQPQTNPPSYYKPHSNVNHNNRHSNNNHNDEQQAERKETILCYELAQRNEDLKHENEDLQHENKNLQHENECLRKDFSDTQLELKDTKKKYTEFEESAKKRIDRLHGDNLQGMEFTELRDLEETLFKSLRLVRKTMNENQSNFQLCQVCYTNKKNVLLRPCNHLSMCDSCSRRVSVCPMCKTFIYERMTVFI